MGLKMMLLALALAALTADAQYFGAGRRQATTTYSTSKRPWWRSFFPSYSPSSALLPDEREIFPEWFDADEPEDCERVPKTVNTGRPRDLCGDNDLDRSFCICLKRPSAATTYHVSGYGTASVSSGQGYEAICGQCRDPCRLRFVPDTFPRRHESSSEEGEDSSKKENGGRKRNNN